MQSPPDLTILVRRTQSEGQISLSFQLKGKTSLPGLSYDEFGPHIFDLDPDAFFERNFADLEYSVEKEEEVEVAEQRLAAKGGLLFSQLLPLDLQEQLWEIKDQVRTVLVVSSEMWIPWELLKFRGRKREPAASGPYFGEIFAITRWIPGVPEVLQLPLQDLALVVTGDSKLQHATDEQQQMRSLGDGGEHRVVEIPARYLDVTRALASGDFDGWHFTGHGIASGMDPDLWSIQLDEQQELRPEDLYGDIGRRRPLVVFNGCKTGRTRRSLHGFGGWAARFLGFWVGAFLGSHWRVRDRTAAAFAAAFYRRFLAGIPIGEAVRQTRVEIRKRYPGDPGWLAYTTFAHPGATCRRWSDEELRGRILDASRLIREKTSGFVGRKWLFRDLDEFLAQSPRGYFIVQGDPGLGKSSWIAELVRQRGYPHHFNIQAEGIQSPERFLGNLCAQLIVRYQPGDRSLPPEAIQDSNYLLSLLERIVSRQARGHKVVLLVDALDEAAPPASPGANPLFLPLRVPEGVYLVVTSRRGVVPRLDCEQRILDIEQDSPDNLADVREYVESRLPGLRTYLEQQRLEAKTFVDAMVGKSQGNFMYLFHVLRELESGDYRSLDFEVLPAGLKSYYEDHWRRMRALDSTEWLSSKLPVLVALTVVKEPVSVDLIARFSGVEDRRKVQAVLEEWKPFLYETVVEDSKTGGYQKRYRLYHGSFHDFIASKDEVAGEHVDLRSAHGRIADYLWTRLGLEANDRADEH